MRSNILFWTGLYGVCVVAALPVAPGLFEALGFAFPAVVMAAGVHWLSHEVAGRFHFLLSALFAGLTMALAVVGASAEEATPPRLVASDLAHQAQPQSLGPLFPPRDPAPAISRPLMRRLMIG